MNKKNIVFAILALIVILSFLSLKILSLSLLQLSAYLLFAFGIYIFFNSNLKKYKPGIVFGSAIFLIGSIVYVISTHELLNIGRVFIPLVLIIIGASLLISTVLQKFNLIILIFSVLCLLAGVLILINRSNVTLALYIEALYSILYNYLPIIIGLVVIILTTILFTRKD